MKNKNNLIVIAVILTFILLAVLYHYLRPLAHLIVYDLFELGKTRQIAESLNFFIYDTIKILILLLIISSLMGIVNVYLPVELLQAYLSTRKLYGFQYLFASFFGAITPFCSCSSIPLFIGFVNGGIPLGVTFSFLITSPLVNEVALAMFLGLFGIKVTLFYALGGIILGTLGGFILGKFNLNTYLTEWVKQVQNNRAQVSQDRVSERSSFIRRLPEILREAWGIVRKVFIYVIIGIAIGALMHGYVPEDFFSTNLSPGSWYAVPLAVILAVPMYANAAGIVPIVQVFVSKGIPLGTAIAFMMAVVGLSIPEATLLKKVMKWKLIAIFFGTVSFFIILLGYLFNWLL
jgi:hypothetical protein